MIFGAKCQKLFHLGLERPWYVPIFYLRLPRYVPYHSLVQTGYILRIADIIVIKLRVIVKRLPTVTAQLVITMAFQVNETVSRLPCIMHGCNKNMVNAEILSQL